MERSGVRKYDCGEWVVQRVAWTELNAGGRFFGCVNGRNGCNYFRWFDPPVCDNARGVICGLLRRIKEHEDELERLKMEHMNELQAVKRTSNWFKYVVFVVVFLFAYLIM